MNDEAWKEAETLTANCTHGLEFAETAEHYADMRERIRACIAYQIIERNRARDELARRDKEAADARERVERE